jgi:hypothetical protein
VSRSRRRIVGKPELIIRFFSWANLNAAGHTKKVVTMSLAFVFQCVGNVSLGRGVP